ncbi:MAG: SDR family NAD(P)-dependent oxidoreductase, partial [Thiohalocapsa sp.]
MSDAAVNAATAADRRVKEQAVRLLQRMQAKLDAAEARLAAPVAIIGMACRLPLGDTPEAFWAALSAGADGIRPVPRERWQAAESGPLAQGGFLDGIDRFDAEFFGISPREAAAMDPQQRLALEVGWHALEDAGIAADRLDESPTGVYLGCCTADYARLGDPDTLAADGYAATGGAPGVAAGRIAYALGLKGPAMVVDTACSSSLVAAHLAVQALRAGECTLALAGGVNLTLLPQGAATLDRLHMLAPDGRCKAFDAAADGFVRGEGCGVVVLKLLAAAERDGDRVLAVIRGSAVGQDGRSAGLTAPSGPAQEMVIRAALANAGMRSDDIDYIEAHGTGTALGDPIEMHALASVFGGRERPLWVASVKSNIGHAEAAAGVAGLVKTVLMLQRQAVPASLHFRQLNPHIDLQGVPIAVPMALTHQSELRAIGVSSFGFSGTNAHIVVTAPPPAESKAMDVSAEAPRLLISARTPSALGELIARYQALLADGAGFADVCHSAAIGRTRLPWWVCVESPDELAAAVPSDAPPPQFPVPPGRRIALPLTPFERRRYWLDDDAPRPGRRIAHAGAETIFEARLSPAMPLVADHRVRGKPLLPAADIVERLLAAAQASARRDGLRDIAFERPVTADLPRLVQTVVEPQGGGLALFVQDGEGWQRAAHAAAAAPAPLLSVQLAALQAGCTEAVPPADFAAWLRAAGLDYGPFYHCIGALWRGPGQALARLLPAAPVALVDAALRVAGAIAYGRNPGAGGGAARLPIAVAHYQRFADPPAGELWAHAALVEENAGATVADIRLLAPDGSVVAALAGLRLAAAPAAPADADEWRQYCHVVEWVAAPSPLAVCAEICAGFGDLRPRQAALDATAAAYAHRALQALSAADVAPAHRRLWQHLPRLAALAGEPADPALPAALPDGPEAALLQRCGEALPDILCGVRDPLALLFEDGGAAAIYARSPVYAAANRIVATLAAAALPSTGLRRVIEIGAGTGGTSAAVIAALADGDTEYWFTDISPSLVAAARGRFAEARCAVFDVERMPGEQGIPEGGFDLVVMANVLHATRDLAAALRHAAAALAPRGMLLLLESVTPEASRESVASWIDLVFGLTPGWWRFADDDLRPDYPLLSRAGWQRLLQKQGFDVMAVPHRDGELPGQVVLLARRTVDERVFRDPGGAAAERCAALLAAIQEMDPAERRLLVVTSGAVGPAIADPAGAALWGMARTLRLERPELEVRSIDCTGSNPDAALAEEWLTAEPELAIADGRRHLPALAPAPEAVEPRKLDPEGWVLVTGAFGGLGRFTAEWLARHGRRRLVLSGREAPERAWVTALREAGVNLRLEACDLADPLALEALIARLPPLAGIVHAAGTLDDAPLAVARPQQFARVLAPKFDAALRLDAAFPELDFFLLFSSAVGLFGQAAQASHVAASVALDALAAARRRRGQHAVSLGWGPWRDIGAAAGRPELVARMTAQGLGTIAGDAGGAVLDWALTTPAAAVAVLPIDRRRFLASFTGSRPPSATRRWQTPRRLPASVPPPEPVAMPAAGALAETVAAEAAAVLGYSPGQAIDRRANLFELGLDSLMAVELRNRLQARLPQRPLASTLVFEHSSIAALAAHLEGTGMSPPAAPAPAADVAADAVIAIVGIGCRFPADGSDPVRFWQALAAGRDGIVPYPDRPDTGVLPGMARPGGYLPDVAGFDPMFFGIAPREAVFMDPQHRLLLEVAWEALEDALIAPDRLAGSATGAFVGMCNYDYAALAATADGADGYAGTGGAPSIAAGRLAYLLGLNGPAMVVDTACSSSLVAVHLAAQALRSGECSMALAGGVNLALGGGTTAALDGLHMLAPDGHCKAFDTAADGFVRSEGCGVVVLKLLSDAQRDGDRVLAVIRGSAVNQDGRSAGLTAPSGPAQEAVIRAALANAGMGA